MDMKLRSIVAKTWIEDHGSLMGDDARSLEAVINAVEEYMAPVGWVWEYMGDTHFSTENPNFGVGIFIPVPFQVYRKT